MYNKWNDNPNESPLGVIRRDRLVDAAERALRRALAADNCDTFTMSYARSLFDKLLSAQSVQEQMEDRCYLRVDEENGMYRIRLLLLDREGNFVPKTTKSYYGYSFTARYIDETVVRYLGGKQERIMANPNT